jgi:hypothetical protein
VTAGTGTTLRDRAAAVLPANDAGGWTRAAPVLYPHQWSWDSAFIAIGWAHLDVRRAMTELESLFAAQWATGMVPHLVFRAGPDHPYFPGPEWWDTSVSPAAPAAPMKTTGISEPAFEAQNYWRGPVWPVIDWLLWQSLHQLGYSARANAIRGDSLSQLVAAGEFGEYFEPFTGKQLGSTQQSWTAAVTLDWLASEHDGRPAGH